MSTSTASTRTPAPTHRSTGIGGNEVKVESAGSKLSAFALRATPTEAAALATLRAYAPLGGVVSGNQLALLMRRCEDQPVSVIARWIVSHRVISFRALSQTLLPLFQFDLAQCRVRPEVQQVLHEWAPRAHEGDDGDADLADWFAQPNAWLGGQAPARVLLHDVAAVREAARADRFVANAMS